MRHEATLTRHHSQTTQKTIAVVGGGIVGMAVTERLLRDGHRVTVIEPGAFGGEQAASYGNGAFISPASIIPMSMPGLWKQVPRYLADPNGPLTIRWPYLPRLLPWLLKFLLAGRTTARVTRTAAALSALLQGAPMRHAALATRAGIPEIIRDQGLLYLYVDRDAFEADRLSWQLRAQFDVQTREVTGDDLRALAPGLADRYRLGIVVTEGRHCHSPGDYVAAIARHCLAQGARRVTAQATGFAVSRGALTGVETTQGLVTCDLAVIAAGIQSKPLSQACGDRIPLESERGYHVEYPNACGQLTMPVMPQDLKVAIVETSGGLRVAGQVEFASATAAPNWHRAALLGDKLRSCFPDLGEDKLGPAPNRWQGHRPSTPDGLPVIGRSRKLGAVLYAFGHGHIGLNAAPMTAELIADLIADRPPEIDIAAFSPARFR